jgi:hypothetical protein
MAEFKVTHTWHLGNGDTATEESAIVMARDSQGRIMWSKITTPRSDTEPPVAQITVNEARARSYSAWNIPGHEVIVQEIPTLRSLEKRCSENHAKVPSSPHGRPKSLDLGTRTIAGLNARGARTTVFSTKPDGESVLVRSNEIWMAITPGLEGLTPLVVIENAADGKTTRELVRFDQSEPSPALFQPPSGYEVVHRTEDQAPCSLTPVPEAYFLEHSPLPSKPH